jgi:cyclopropane-fatty-acyl-phospholipid synthase
MTSFDISSIAPSAIRTVVDRKTESVVSDLFRRIDIEIDGSRPHDIQLHDRRFFNRVLRDGSLGLGEAYMDGWWDSEALDHTLFLIMAGDLMKRAQQSWTTVALAARARLVNPQSTLRATEVAHRHYDIGNDLYQAMLGRHMAYTCAYWEGADDLDEAQARKLDLVCRKIGLTRGMRVLDLGCGWASFAKFAAENYGAAVTGITISKPQAELGAERCAGFPVEILCDDYRNARGSYDAVISIGIMEHVGPRNYERYLDVVDRCLGDGGIGFIHTIGGNRKTSHTDPWIDRYIFPNAVLPTLGQLTTAMHDRHVIEDVHNIGPHYDRTLMAWQENFERSWPSLADRYGERFRRMWTFYLSSCAAGFRARYMQLYQIVFTRPPTPQPRCRLS